MGTKTSTIFQFMSLAQQERRRHDRHAINAQAVLLDGDNKSLGIVWCRDISRAGVRLESQRPIPPGSRVSVRLNSSHGSKLQLAGSVVRVDGDSFGVRFFATDWFTNNSLLSLVARMRGDLQMLALVAGAH